VRHWSIPKHVRHWSIPAAAPYAFPNDIGASHLKIRSMALFGSTTTLRPEYFCRISATKLWYARIHLASYMPTSSFIPIELRKKNSLRQGLNALLLTLEAPPKMLTAHPRRESQSSSLSSYHLITYLYILIVLYKQTYYPL
jgi:hypothetical protein